MSVPIRPATVAGVRLDALARAAPGRVVGAPAVTVTGVTLSSDRVRRGDLFAALPGASTHGARFAAAALERGACAVLTDAPGAALVEPGTPLVLAEDARAATARVAGEVYGHPDRVLAAVAVTGTSGKTTTSFLIQAGLLGTGHAAGLIGTVGTFAGDPADPATVLTTGLTTPEAPDLYALLAVLRERGLGHVVMEVSSHALVQERVGGMRFAVAAFTNLSQDHLDFHPDMEDYFAAKARLFDGRAARQAIVVDDDWGRRLAGQAARAGTVTVSTSARAADWTVRDLRIASDGSSRFTAVGPSGPVPAGCRIPGAYNVANALLALAVLDALDVPGVEAAAAVAAAQVPGRMERVEAGQDFAAVVDYAHKPAAVTGALDALRPMTTGRLIVVLGCGGDRDRGKRPLMGAAAAQAADVLIATDDNPRREDPAAIRAAMLAGARDVPAERRARIEEVGPRADAIATAVAMARAGDTVLIAGKGHETGQEVDGVKHPFDDRLVLREAIVRAAAR